MHLKFRQVYEGYMANGNHRVTVALKKSFYPPLIEICLETGPQERSYFEFDVCEVSSLIDVLTEVNEEAKAILDKNKDR